MGIGQEKDSGSPKRRNVQDKLKPDTLGCFLFYGAIQKNDNAYFIYNYNAEFNHISCGKMLSSIQQNDTFCGAKLC